MLVITKIKAKREHNPHLAKYYLYRFKKYLKKKRFWKPCRCWGRSMAYIDYPFQNLPASSETCQRLLKPSQTFWNIPFDSKNLPKNIPSQQIIDFVSLNILKYNIWTGNSSNLRLGPVPVAAFDRSMFVCFWRCLLGMRFSKKQTYLY